jgi:[ribosomal protein S5]-alanine N-acetyltransferase
MRGPRRQARLTLTGAKVELREFTRDHLRDPAYLGWLREPAVMGTVNRVEYLLPLEFGDVAAYVRKAIANPAENFFAIHLRRGGRFVGTLRLFAIDWRARQAEIGIMIGDRRVWGRGLGTDAVRVAATYAIDVLGLERLHAGTPEPNKGMTKAFLNVGFRIEGRLRKHVRLGATTVDRLLFGMLARELAR